MEEVFAGGFQKFEDILFTFGRAEKNSKFVIGKLIKSFFKGIGRIDFFELVKTKKLLQGAALILLGILFICFQEVAAKIVGITFFMWMLMYSAYRLLGFYQSYKNEERFDKYKAVFYGAIAGMEVLCIIKNNIILLSVNLILGAFFLWHSWKNMKKMTLQRACKKKVWILYLADCLISGILGIVALAISNRGSGDFSLAAGSYLLFWGGGSETVRAMYQNIGN